MLKHQYVYWIFVVVIAIMAGQVYVGNIPWYSLAIPSLIFPALMAYGSTVIGSGYYIETVCTGNTKEKIIALTFDDGPEPLHTEKILDVLKQNEIHAAFFFIGNKMEKYPDVVKRVVAEGHLIGNHSYSHHRYFDLFPRQKMVSELQQTNNIAERITGKKLKFFRPPYGVTTPVLAKAINALNFTTIGWNIRSLDTVINDPSRLLNRIAQRLHSGGILLLHDTAPITQRSLQKIIDRIGQQGYSFARLDQLIQKEPYA